MKRVWYAIVAVVVVVFAIGSVAIWSVKRKQAVEKYIPKGAPETYEQMKGTPAESGGL
ncbi:MAG: hypothetical protein NZ781_12360 [Armatimonadetes bacterium]|nr:hypothetical protein [Armatimonadota bacterium]